MAKVTSMLGVGISPGAGGHGVKVIVTSMLGVGIWHGAGGYGVDLGAKA